MIRERFNKCIAKSVGKIKECILRFHILTETPLGFQTY